MHFELLKNKTAVRWLTFTGPDNLFKSENVVVQTLLNATKLR